MTLTKLELINFKRYRQKEFNFTLGLTGLLGKNGSGKSTIFEAIIFALYGESDTNRELLKNSECEDKEPVEVSLYFDIVGKEYLVKRELRGKSLTAKANLYDGSGELIATSVKEVNAQIVKLIGMNKEAFSNTVYASQKQLSALSTLKSEERKKIIRKLLGLEKIDKIEKELIYKIRELKRDIKSFGELLISPEELDNINKQIADTKELLEQNTKELKELNKQELQAQEKVKKALQKLEEQQRLKESFNKLNSTISQLKLNTENTTKNLQQVEQNLNNLLKDQDFFNANKELIKSFKELESQILKHQKDKEQNLKKEGLLKEQASLREELKALRLDIKKLTANIAKKKPLEEEKVKLELKLKELEGKLATLEAQERVNLKEQAQAQALIDNTAKQLNKIKSLGKESKCPTCTRALLDEYDSVVNSLSSTINNITNTTLKSVSNSLQEIIKQKQNINLQIQTTRAKLQELNNQITTLTSQESELKRREERHNQVLSKGLQNKKELESLVGLKYEKELHQKLIEQKAKIEPTYNKLLSTQKLLEQIPKLKTDKTELEANLEKLNNQLKIKNLELKEHSFSQEQESKAKLAYQEALKAKEVLHNSIKQAEVNRAKLNGEISNLNSTLEQNSKQLAKLKVKEIDRDDYEKLKLFLVEFKSKINSQITPRISKIASDMFYEVTQGKYQLIEVDNDFNFFIYDEGKKYPIERFSGGEIDLANLILRIAISKTLNELNTNTNIGFLAFDEIFGSQDENRRYAIMESFNKISENYRQIFLISHDKEIKEMFEFVIEL